MKAYERKKSLAHRAAALLTCLLVTATMTAGTVGNPREIGWEPFVTAGAAAQSRTSYLVNLSGLPTYFSGLQARLTNPSADTSATAEIAGGSASVNLASGNYDLAICTADGTQLAVYATVLTVGGIIPVVSFVLKDTGFTVAPPLLVTAGFADKTALTPDENGNYAVYYGRRYSVQYALRYPNALAPCEVFYEISKNNNTPMRATYSTTTVPTYTFDVRSSDKITYTTQAKYIRTIDRQATNISAFSLAETTVFVPTRYTPALLLDAPLTEIDFGDAITLGVTLDPATVGTGDYAPAGTLVLEQDGKQLASAVLTDGRATLATTGTLADATGLQLRFVPDDTAADYYTEATLPLSLTVNTLDATDRYTVSPAEPDGTNGWYTRDIILAPSTSADNPFDRIQSGGKTLDELVLSDETTGSTVDFNLYSTAHKTGSNAASFSYKRDSIAPTQPEIDEPQLKKSQWDNGKDKWYYYPNATGENPYNLPEMDGFRCFVLTLRADDRTSGVHHFTLSDESGAQLSYLRQNGTDVCNSAGVSILDTTAAEILADSDGTALLLLKIPVGDNPDWTAIWSSAELLRKQLRALTLVAVDNAGNCSDGTTVALTEDISVTFAGIADAVGLDAGRSQTEANARPACYLYNAATTATISVPAQGFVAANFTLALTCNGTAVELPTVAWTKMDERYTTTVALSGDGEYQLTVSAADRGIVGNDSGETVYNTYTSAVHIIDTTAPVLAVTFDTADTADNLFAAARTATIRVTEQNFNPAYVLAEITATDITGAAAPDAVARLAVAVQRLQAPASWTCTTDTAGTPVYEATLAFDADAVYDLTLSCTDWVRHAQTGEAFRAGFTVDTTAPENLEISYSTSLLDTILETITFGFYNAPVTITLTAEDVTSGAASFAWRYTRAADASAVNTALRNGILTAPTQSGSTFTAAFTLDAQANGCISFDATDRAGNTTNPALADSRRLVVDTIAPTRAAVTYAAPVQLVNAQTLATYASADDIPADTAYIAYYDGDITASIVINEANFFAEDVVVSVNGKRAAVSAWSSSGDDHTATLTISGDGTYTVQISYTDRSANKMTDYTSHTLVIDTARPEISVAFAPDEPANVIAGRTYYNTPQRATVTVREKNFRAADMQPRLVMQDISKNDISEPLRLQLLVALTDEAGWTHEGDVHTCVLSFSADANYSFDLDYRDLSGHAAADAPLRLFTVDTDAPGSLRASYSTSLLSRVLEAVTFGYYNAPVTVKLTAEDRISGVYSIKWAFDAADNGADMNGSEIIYTDSSPLVSCSITIPPEANGSVRFTAFDRAANSTEPEYDDADSYRVVIDTIAPTCTVSYPAARQAVDAATLQTLSAGEAPDADAILYYDHDVPVLLSVSEANFYPEDLDIRVNGVSRTVSGWTRKGDTHTAALTLSGDGDYRVTIAYTDRSTNEMTDYTSPLLTIDTTAPVVSVTLAPGAAVRELDGRVYYAAAQRATVTVTEHNFRADDFAAALQITDVSGAAVAEALRARLVAALSDRSSWKTVGDRHTATLDFSADGNYTLDVSYRDLAQLEMADYAENRFTVDTTAPTALGVTYSTSLAGELLSTATLGYYNAQAVVTITATDDTSGVFAFDYSALRTPGASLRNEEIINRAISGAEMTYSADGRTATASFTIPLSVLLATTQFDGNVQFTAHDRADNAAALTDLRRIVVDSVAPVLTVSYNGTPAQSGAPAAFYSDTIAAEILVDETNFHAEDVHVTVTKDGAALPVQVAWSDRSVELHTGSFALSGDGSYTVAVSYTDRSQNAAANYQSGRLTIDSRLPELTLSGVQDSSANNAETIGFAITAQDENMDPSELTATVSAVLQQADGTFITQTFDGVLETVAAGSTYVLRFENFTDDGIYTVTCHAADRAGNETTAFLAEGSGSHTLQSLTFSVNRGGSVFSIDEATAKLIETFFVSAVENDIVVYEANVDNLESREITVKNGSSARTLTEGTDYDVENTGGSGKWHRFTYRIHKALFAEEGEYSVSVVTRDRAGNDAYNDIKNAEINFTVDLTAPVLTVSGIKSGGIYRTSTQSVSITPRDDGGKLEGIRIVTHSNSGVETGLLEWSGEELTKLLDEKSGKLVFDVPGGYNQEIEITGIDQAGNDTGTVYYYDSVTVSTSRWVAFYANKPLFFGCIAGAVVLLAAVVVLLVILRRRKKPTRGLNF